MHMHTCRLPRLCIVSLKAVPASNNLPGRVRCFPSVNANATDWLRNSNTTTLHDRSSRRVARVVVVARCSFCVRCPVTGFEPTARAPAHSVCPSDQSDLSAHGPCAMHCPCPRLVSSLRTATRLHTTTRASCVAPHMTLHVPQRALPLSSTMHVPNSSPAPASGKASQDCGVPVHPAAVQLQPSVLLGGGGGDGAQGA